MLKKLFSMLVAGGLLVILLPASVQGKGRNQADSAVTLRIGTGQAVTTFDPQIASDAASLTAVENLFLGLTQLDPLTNQIVPELADEWWTSEDGFTWTFRLRDDVMWLRYNPRTGEAVPVRPVVASDVVFGIKRGCDPRLGGYYGKVLADIITGCHEVYHTDLPDVDDELVYGATIQVRALDSHMVAIDTFYYSDPAEDGLDTRRVQQKVAYLPAVAALPVMRPVYRQDLQAEAGGLLDDAWTVPGEMVSNGPYFLHGASRETGYVYVRNTALPDDLRGAGNIEQVEVWLMPEEEVRANGFAQGDIDWMPEVSDTNLPGFVRRMKRPATYYFGFNQTNAPFDSVYMRRAFGAVIDRQRFVAEVLDGKGLPLSVFMPPDVPGGDMSVNESVGFNPAYAREQMILAGYPDCAGLPPVLVETFDNAEAWADFLVASAVEHLGCPAETFEVRTVDYSNWWFEGPLYEHIFAGGWGPLFPDAHGWQGEWLHCTADNYLFRSCSAVDDWLVGAAETTDESARVELYRRVESAFFGPEGEMPVIPLFQPLSNVRVRAGIDGPFETDGGFSAVHWDAYSINREQR